MEQKQERRGFTVKDYCKLKGLSDGDWWFLSDVYEITYYDQKPAVAFPYGIKIDGKWEYTGIKLRLSEDSHHTIWAVGVGDDWWGDRRRWRKAEAGEVRTVPYGLREFVYVADDPDDPEDLVIVEGESDVHTLWTYNIPTLGISGKNGWKPEFADIDVIRNSARIFIVKELPTKEGDKSGEEFVQRVAKDLPPEKVFVLTLPVKDPSALHLRCLADPHSQGFRAVFDAAVVEAQRFEPAVQKTQNEPLRGCGIFRATDAGNAKRMAALHGENIRCVTDEEKFARWQFEKGVWVKGQDPKLLQPLAIATVETITPENTIWEVKGDELWQRKSESLQKIKAMLGSLWNINWLHVRSDVFDRYLMKLNVQNCTIDLETETPYEFKREDYLTKQAPVRYDKDAKCPQFDAFMERTFKGDQDVIRWMLKALGYSLTGIPDEQCFFVCLGPGGTGKSTLLDLMARLLGQDYAIPADLSIFDKNSKRFASAQGYETATYKNMHFVSASEPEKKGMSVEFDEAVIKKLTGGEELKPRQIYQPHDRFYPRLKLWFGMNHRPIVDTDDTAILRRIIIIPFDNVVKEKDEKAALGFSKRLFEKEGSGILNRLLGGLKLWWAEGLRKHDLPLAIMHATGEYHKQKHIIEQFFARTAGDPDYWERAGYLYAAYQVWANEVNVYLMDGKSFAAELERRKFVRVRGNNSKEKGSGYIWHGVRLRDDYKDQAISTFEKSKKEEDT
jgi:putative DNA primase/helicase